jgi:3-hydroxymyristoyl/3-hydroxydecanoyl-(acyl carrier protein) dehydratase
MSNTVEFKSPDTQIEIANFLGVDIPSGFARIGTDDGGRSLDRRSLKSFSQECSEQTAPGSLPNIQRYLTLMDIHQLTPERAPGMVIERAVICNLEQEHLILSGFTVTEAMCAGHMPGFPILPLAEAGRILAQAGSILVGYSAQVLEGQSGYLTPLVYKVGEVVSGQQGYLFPGDALCVVAKLRKLRGPLYFVQAHAYQGNAHLFSMPKIYYFLSNEARLWGVSDHEQLVA